MEPTDLLTAAYTPLLAFADDVDEDLGWTPTELPGWTTRDLIFHLAGDAQRALVALATPAAGEPDTDEVTYWAPWRPGSPQAQDGLRGTRIMASAWSSVRGPAELYAETARAVLVAAGRAEAADVVRTQGRTLTVAALLHTLAVEAAVHHLDLAPVLPDPPAATVMVEVRRVLTGLLGAELPEEWDDVTAVRTGTGRRPLAPADRASLADKAELFPLFG